MKAAFPSLEVFTARLRAELDLEPAELTIDGSWTKELGFDSLFCLELYLAAEDIAGVGLSPDSANARQDLTIRLIYEELRAVAHA